MIIIAFDKMSQLKMGFVSCNRELSFMSLTVTFLGGKGYEYSYLI